MVLFKKSSWLVLLSMSTAHSYNQPIQLTDNGMKIIKKFDGNLLDGEIIRQIMFIRCHVNNMMIGIPTRNERVGKYDLCGQKTTLKQLVRKEKKVKELLNNPEISEQQKQKLLSLKDEIQKCLSTIKKDFVETALPFLDRVIQLKKITIPIIEEWAQKRNRLDTMLLEGIKSNKNVVELFNERVTTAEYLVQFSDDLEDFLATFVYNCPRAHEQFKKELSASQS